MSQKTYAEKLRDPRWQKKRLEIMERDNFRCVICSNADDTLNVHHFSYSSNPWETPNEELITTCETCHKKIKTIDYAIIPVKIELYKYLIQFDMHPTAYIADILLALKLITHENKPFPFNESELIRLFTAAINIQYMNGFLKSRERQLQDKSKGE